MSGSRGRSGSLGSSNRKRTIFIGYIYATFHKQTLLCHKVNSCKLHGSREWWSLLCVCVCITDRVEKHCMSVYIIPTRLCRTDEKISLHTILGTIISKRQKYKSTIISERIIFPGHLHYYIMLYHIILIIIFF